MKTTTTYIVRTFGDASQLDPLMYGIGISVFELDEVEFFETEGNQSTLIATANPSTFDKFEAILDYEGLSYEVVKEQLAKPFKSMNTLNNLEFLITKWSEDRMIIQNGTIAGQSKKLGEEFGELIAGLVKEDRAEVIDAIGDMVVVLNNIAVMSGSTLTECVDSAYSEIKDRKGTLMPDGTFKKEAK